jgi:hypothetical protein
MARTKLCWICGKPVKQSAEREPKCPFHLEVRLVEVWRPFTRDVRSKPVFICDNCAIKKIGMNGEGKNLNK